MLAVREVKLGDDLDRFRGKVEAAVALNGVTDLRAGAPSTAPLDGAFRLLAGDDPKARADASPITFVSKDSAPTLFIVGDLDNLVPNAQSQSMADALKKAGAEAEVLTLKGQSHGIFPAITPKARDATLEFLDAHLKP
jgi:dipeptidyl aminopeptidase/acylaminoacyl peptidase